MRPIKLTNTHAEGHLQQEGDLGTLIELLLIRSQPPQDVFVAGEVIARSSYVVESGAVPALTDQTGAGGQAEVGRAPVAMTTAAEEHVILQLGGILGNLG